MEKYGISIDSEKKIKSRFGDEFYLKLEKNLEKYSNIWQLQNFSLVDSFSVNCVFYCRSQIHGGCVLKIGPYIKESLTEYESLKDYGGWPFCFLREADAGRGIILVERIYP